MTRPAAARTTQSTRRALPSATAQLTLVVVVQILVISCWFATGAALPSLTVDYELSDAERLGLIVVVQLGFAVAAVAVGLTRLPDRVRPRLLLPSAAALTAAATLLPLQCPTDLTTLFISRFLVGACLAAVYPTGMRAALSWTGPRRRGLAVGAIVTALTLGTAAPQLLVASPLRHWQTVFITVAVAAVVGAAASLGLRTGPHGSDPQRSPMRAVTELAQDRIQRRIALSYIGHMWEVYALWVWLPAFLVTLPALAGGHAGGGTASIGLLAFVIIGIAGAVGCTAGGLLSVRYGKRRVARAAVAISASCALTSPLLSEAPFALALVILLLWGAAAIADSPLFSAMTGDEARGRPLGAALALQMGIGYSVSATAIGATALVASAVGWRWAMITLAPGPLMAVLILRPWTARLQATTADSRSG